MNALSATYGVYLAACVLVTLTVGRTLFRHGRGFLLDVFAGSEFLADTANRLLLVGFYILNIALSLFLLRSELQINNWRSAADLLGTKLGIVLLTLGVMHFQNVLVLFIIKQQFQRRLS